MNQALPAQAQQFLEIAQRLVRLPADKQARFLETLAARGVSPARLPIARFPVEDEAPLSYAQRRLWFLWKLDPASAAYNLHQAVRLRGALDVVALRAAFDALVHRHASLRTTFHEADGGIPIQRLSADAAFSLAVEDLSPLGDDEREAAQRARVEADATTPFDLTRGPLLRVSLLRLAPDDHMLLVAMHHIVSDGWSMGVAVSEFGRLYAACCAGEPLDLPAPPVRYVDYACWQRLLVEAGESARQLEYWRAKLAGGSPALELPADHLRPALQSGRGGSLELRLDAALTGRLRQLASQHGATLFMVLLAGFKTLLYRYTGQGDLSVGVPIANRNRAETEGIIGFFVNTQVLRDRIDGREGFDAVLRAVRATALEAQDHQDLPFEQLVEALRPERSLSLNPLFQVMFNHGAVAGGAAQLPGLVLETVPRELTAVSFDLALDTAEIPDGGLLASFSYATDLFERSTIERLGRHFQGLLTQVVEAPQTPVGSLRLLDDDEYAALSSANALPGVYPSSPWVHEVIAAQARALGEAPAVLCGESSIGFAELDARAEHLAGGLRAQGVGPDVLVGIALGRSPDLIVALLAVLKAGGGYVPLDVDYPAERLAYMLEDSGVGLLLTQTSLLERLPTSSARVYCLDRDLDAGPGPDGYGYAQPILQKPWAGEVGWVERSDTHQRPPGRNRDVVAIVASGPSAAAPATGLGATAEPGPDGYRFAQPILHSVATTARHPMDRVAGEGGRAALHGQNLAYVIYTSGSTGRPKGVAVTHGPLAMHCRAIGALYEMGPHSRELHFMSFAFDGAHERWLTTLMHGGSLVLRDDTLWTPEQTYEALHRYRVTVAAFPPAYLLQLAEHARERGEPPAVDIYCFGGDAVPEASYALARESLKPRYLTNGYGPTETVVTPLLWKAANSDDCGSAYAPIGRRVGERSTWVLDADLNPVPIGVAGELYLGGEGLARGYHGRAGITAERFVPDPFGAPGGRLYRSGDLVRQRPDGILDCLGRIDHQVKIRGFRIELGEIEARLREVPGVREAVVVARETPTGKQLVGYVAAGGQEPPAGKPSIDDEAASPESPTGKAPADNEVASPPGIAELYSAAERSSATDAPGSAEATTQSHPPSTKRPADGRLPSTTRRSQGGEGSASDAATPTPEALKAHLKTALPDYMVPAQILVLERLPLTPAGKIDRQNLPDPAWQGREYIAPRTEQERALAAIWQEVLGIEQVGLTDNFFELGGDSLQTLKVISRIRARKELGLTLKLRDLMQKPTIAELLGVSVASAAPNPLVALNRQGVGERPLFCLHAGFGTVYDYDKLARHLDGEVTVYGIQCRMLLDPAWRDQSLERMAADYATLIRERQPTGPYRLVGWSLGGTLAVLVARELETGGERVDVLGFIDGFVPGELAADVEGSSVWQDELASFIQAVLPGLDEARSQTLLQRLVTEPDLAALTDIFAGILGDTFPREDSGYAMLGAEELAQIFATARRLKALAESQASLPPIVAQPRAWWRPDRRLARALLDGQIGQSTASGELDSTHFGILQEHDLIAQLSSLLAAHRQPVDS